MLAAPIRGVTVAGGSRPAEVAGESAWRRDLVTLRAASAARDGFRLTKGRFEVKQFPLEGYARERDLLLMAQERERNDAGSAAS